MWNQTWNRSKKQNLDELDGLVKNHGITLGTFGSEGSGYVTMMDFVRDFRILKKALLESKDLDEARDKIEEMDEFLKELYEQGPNYLVLDNMRLFEKILKQKIIGYMEDCGEGVDMEFYDPSTHECIDGEIREKVQKFGFGKRRKRKFGKKKKKKRKKKTVRKSKVKKVSSDLKKRCKKHKIRLSVKRGSKRVPKSEKVLKKQLAKKMKTMKKKKAATKRKTVKRRRKRRSGYGASKGRSSLGMGPYPGSLMMRTPYFEMVKKA